MLNQMGNLPFVVQPKRKPIIEYIGSEESGQVAIERRGYLTSGEKAFVQQALGADETSIRVIALSRKVANSHNLSLDVAYRQVAGILSGQLRGDDQATEIETEYFNDFNDLIGHLASVQSREQILKALCMVQYRINSDSTVSDIMELHPDILNGLVELYNDEEMKSTERLIANESGSNDSDSDEDIDASADVEASQFQALEKKPRSSRRQTQ